MNKHKKLPLFWAAFSLLLLFTVNPALAGSSAKPVDVDTLFNCTWTAAAVAPALNVDSPVVTVGGNMYLFGGVQGGAISAASFKFDGTTWTPIAPLPTAVEFPAAVTDGTNCYILGGALTGTGTPQTTVYRYNVALNTYTTLAPFTVGVWNASAVYLAGKIYKWCGTGPATASANALEIYDVGLNTWSAGAPYPLLISFTSGWTQGGFIYSSGGIQSVGSVASAKTYRYDPVGNTWDDLAIADLPATRWGAAVAFYSPDPVLVGGYVAGSVTANISNTALSWDQPSNTWNSIPNALQARTRFTAAVLNGSVYAVGGRCPTVGVCDAFQGTNDNQKLQCLNVPTNVLTSIGSYIVAAGANGVLDPGEAVTVGLGVKNTGGPGVVCTTAALTGTLAASGGVTVPSGPQNYGVICSGGALGASRPFTFTVDPALPCGSTVTASLQMQDGATNYGTFNYSFLTGSSAVAFTQNFDGVVAPALPAGWTTAATGIEVPWVTSTTTPFSAPNEAFAPDPSNVGDTVLDSPSFAVGAGGGTLTFKLSYNTEPTFDGVVLEISIAGGAFADIITAGGTFVSNPYTGPISTAFASPIAGRNAWNGNSGGYRDCGVTLPPAASGQNVQLRWRMASDNSVAATGVMLDNVSIAAPVCGGTAPAVTSVASRQVHNGVPQDITGVECRQGSGPSLNGRQLIVTFTNPVAIGGVSVTSLDGLATGTVSVSGNVATVDLANVANAQVVQVALTNASDGLGGVNIGLPILLGDVNGNGVVNGGDTIAVRPLSGSLVPPGNPRADINLNGTINAGDTLLIRAASGTALP